MRVGYLAFYHYHLEFRVPILIGGYSRESHLLLLNGAFKVGPCSLVIDEWRTGHSH